MALSRLSKHGTPRLTVTWMHMAFRGVFQILTCMSRALVVLSFLLSSYDIFITNRGAHFLEQIKLKLCQSFYIIDFGFLHYYYFGVGVSKTTKDLTLYSWSIGAESESIHTFSMAQDILSPFLLHLYHFNLTHHPSFTHAFNEKVPYINITSVR